jgi:hypothetical protein
MKIDLGDKRDLEWAQATVAHHHYLHQATNPKSRPMAYILSHQGERLGLIIVGQPHATRCRGWWGYPGLITQWQVLDLSRIWLDPAIQVGGRLARPGVLPGRVDGSGEFRPNMASWMIANVLKRVQRDRVAMWPPVLLDDPYHIRLVISYHDPQYHRGTIYRATNALPLYTDDDGRPTPGPSGKFAWAWRLPEPRWTWRDLEIRQPRTLRMVF